MSFYSKIFSLILVVLLVVLQQLPGYSEEKEVPFLDDPYGKEIEKTLLQRKSNTKNQKDKKKKDITLTLDAEDSSTPLIFPCEGECQIVDEELPNTFCRHKCGETTKCQGRIDTRIWQYYFAVCVPVL